MLGGGHFRVDQPGNILKAEVEGWIVLLEGGDRGVFGAAPQVFILPPREHPPSQPLAYQDPSSRCGYSSLGFG